MNYFTDEDPEIRKLIEECMGPIEDKADYLLNCLALKCRQRMTVKEIFEQELRAKKQVEEMCSKSDCPNHEDCHSENPDLTKGCV
jgi:lipoate synthase